MAWESGRDPICKGKPTLPCDLLQVPVKFVWQFNGLAHCVLLDTALPENRRFRRDSQRPPTAADRVEKTVGQPILAASRLSGGWTGWKARPTFSWTFAGRRPIPTDDKNRSSVPLPARLPGRALHHLRPVLRRHFADLRGVTQQHEGQVVRAVILPRHLVGLLQGHGIYSREELVHLVPSQAEQFHLAQYRRDLIGCLQPLQRIGPLCVSLGGGELLRRNPFVVEPCQHL